MIIIVLLILLILICLDNGDGLPASEKYRQKFADDP